MTKTEEIKQDIEKLDFTIQQLLINFVNRNGICDIKINVYQSFYIEQGSGKRISERIDVKTEITI